MTPPVALATRRLGIVPPAELFDLYQRFVVEEALSVVRHDLRNKLGSIRNAAFYLGRRVAKAAPALAEDDPRVPQLFAMIGDEVERAEVLVRSRLPSADRGEQVSAAAIAFRLHELVAFPAHISSSVETTSTLLVRADANEAAVALFCLIENAVDAMEGRGGNIQLRVSERGGRAALEVEDDGPGFAGGVFERAFEPFFSTRHARMGIGLNIAQRIAARWDGAIEIVPRLGGVSAALVLGAA